MIVVFFLSIFWLLYAIGVRLHESNKIVAEIEAIQKQNEKMRQEKLQKEERVIYLKTPQRIDKEAKMQMGKKLEGEHVLVFIEEELDILPIQKKTKIEVATSKDIPIVEKWKWFFFHE